MIKFLLVLVFMVGLINWTEAKCKQKHATQEAKEDPYLCKNQMFEAGKMIADEENCQCYYHCNFRRQPCYTCCSDGQVFYPKLGQCVHSSSYACSAKPARFQCPSPGVHRHEHCRKYWDCHSVFGLPVERACPEQHHWDDRSKLCRKDTEVVNLDCKH